MQYGGGKKISAIQIPSWKGEKLRQHQRLLDHNRSHTGGQN